MIPKKVKEVIFTVSTDGVSYVTKTCGRYDGQEFEVDHRLRGFPDHFHV